MIRGKRIYFWYDFEAYKGSYDKVQWKVVFGLRSSLEIFKGLGISCQKLLRQEGGAKPSLSSDAGGYSEWADLYNKNNEQACVGAAITAAVAAGEYQAVKKPAAVW